MTERQQRGQLFHVEDSMTRLGFSAFLCSALAWGSYIPGGTSGNLGLNGSLQVGDTSTADAGVQIQLNTAGGPVIRMKRTSTNNRYDWNTDGTNVQWIARDNAALFQFNNVGFNGNFQFNGLSADRTYTWPNISGSMAILGANNANNGIFGYNNDVAITRDGVNGFAIGSGAAGNTAGYVKGEGFMASGGTKFTTSGCAVSATTGGATAGTYTSGTTGACTVVITMNGATGLTAPVGWACDAADVTTVTDKQQQITPTSTTQATISGTTVSGDVIVFKCVGF